MAGDKKSYFAQAWLVLVLAMFYGAALAGVHMNFSPKIEENKLNETRQRVPELVLGEAGAKQAAASGKKLTSTRSILAVGQGGGRTTSYSVFKATEGDKIEGWVAKASGQGYADKLELLIGLSPDLDKITGLFVLDQKETPGLGANIVGRAWRGQFAGKTTAQSITAVKTGAKGPNEIDAVTGATISSRSVCAIVNKTIADLKKPLGEEVKRAETSQ